MMQLRLAPSDPLCDYFNTQLDLCVSPNNERSAGRADIDDDGYDIIRGACFSTYPCTSLEIGHLSCPNCAMLVIDGTCLK